jgi:hypothetical protein
MQRFEIITTCRPKHTLEFYTKQHVSDAICKPMLENKNREENKELKKIEEM